MTRTDHMDEAGFGRLRSGEPDAFAELVRKHQRALLAVACTLLPKPEAEEAVQEAWISAYRALPAFEGRSSIKTWLTRIVINQAKMRLRKNRKAPISESSLHAPLDDMPLADRFSGAGHWTEPPSNWGFDRPEDLLQEQELRECLDKTLLSLPQAQRLAVELRDLQGHSLEDICNLLDVSASNVRVLLHRGRAKLFLHVERFEETGEC